MFGNLFDSVNVLRVAIVAGRWVCFVVVVFLMSMLSV